MTARTKSLVVHPHVCRLLINQGSFASLNTITQDYLKCYNKVAFFFIFFHFL